MDDVDVIMFDFYGTVVDMQRGLTEAIAPLLAGRGYEGDPGRVVTWWRRTHFENSMIDALLGQGHTPYREIGRRAVSYTLARAGVPFERADAESLVAAIERLDPFPDVVAALAALQPSFRLVVLSNGDPDMLERGTAHVGFPFDLVLSVAEAGAFKPHAATYAMACERAGVAPDRVLFVANHAFDCVGAKAAGMRTAFVDRRRRPFGETPYAPDVIVSDFAHLAASLGDAGAASG